MKFTDIFLVTKENDFYTYALRTHPESKVYYHETQGPESVEEVLEYIKNYYGTKLGFRDEDE